MHAQRARRADPDRWIKLQWARDPASNFTVGLDVSALNKRGVLGRIAVAIAKAESIHFKIEVRDRTHLARVIRTIRRVKHVVQIARPRGGGRAHPHDAA